MGASGCSKNGAKYMYFLLDKENKAKQSIDKFF